MKALAWWLSALLLQAPAEELSFAALDDPTVWPNRWSKANSDPWIAEHHDQLRQMRPRVLVLNFANGIGVGGNDELQPGRKVDEELLREKAEAFLHLLRTSSRHQQRHNPEAPAFLDPQLERIVDLQDDNGHVNSSLFPRGQLLPDTPGYRTVGYYHLFSEEYARRLGYRAGDRYLTLAELAERGIVHDVIMMANQVDGREPNPPDQVTAHILEVAFVVQAYDEDLRPLPGEFIKNGISFERQKESMDQATFHDHNSMPWIGRSLRIYFLNISRGVGCLLHSLAHDLEFRYNESRVCSPGKPYHGDSVLPYMQPLFREYAGFDLEDRYQAPFSSLYAGGDGYSYEDADGDGVCEILVHANGKFLDYDAFGGNCHYPPGAARGYDYEPAATVWSSCETFRQPNSKPQPLSRTAWDDLSTDPAIDGDCGGKFLVYWLQNMPGLSNKALDLEGQAMKNWWPFLYY
jgi:hypothetical protein